MRDFSSKNFTVGRRERKLEQTVAHLADCAWALFNQHGFAAVTMDSIATAADVARGTLYKHFPVKEALIDYRFRQDQHQHETVVRNIAMSAASIEAGFLAVFNLEAAYAERMRDFVAPYVFYRLSHAQEQANPFENDSFAPLALELIQRGQSTGEITPQIDALALTENLIFLRLATLLRWLRAPETALIELYAGMLTSFFHGAAPRPHSDGE
jgi:AcrR family transcriptional regulator